MKTRLFALTLTVLLIAALFSGCAKPAAPAPELLSSESGDTYDYDVYTDSVTITKYKGTDAEGHHPPDPFGQAGHRHRQGSLRRK